MSLAFQNLLHDRTRFLVTALGVAFAVFLMIFQGSLLIGFLRTAAEVIDAADSDIWITARGVNCFDFSATLDSRFREIAQGVPEEAVYLILRVTNYNNITSVKEQLKARLPAVDVWTQDEFGRRSKLYWISQTGAGAAILTAAVLAFLIGLVVVSQTIYATTMEHLDEFATLKALGASQRFVIKVVLNQSLACCVAGCVLGLLATIPMVAFARRAVALIYTPGVLMLVRLVASVLMCVLASIMSIRTALSVEPAKVFRV